MLADTTAFFSVVFAAEQFEGTCDDCITLNYTIYGSENFIAQGFWLDSYVNFTTDNSMVELMQQVRLKIFVANTRRQNGLDGVIGLGLSQPENEDYSMIRQLNKDYGYPMEVLI